MRMMDASIITALIWAISLMISVLTSLLVVLRHMRSLAEIDDEGKTRREEERTHRALGVARAEIMSDKAEYAAMNSGFNETSGTPDIMALLSNPAIQTLLASFRKKDEAIAAITPEKKT